MALKRIKRMKKKNRRQVKREIKMGSIIRLAEIILTCLSIKKSKRLQKALETVPVL